MAVEGGFVPLVVQVLGKKSTRRLGLVREDFMGKKAARWRARQVRGNLLSLLSEPLVAIPEPLHVRACVCTHRGQQGWGWWVPGDWPSELRTRGSGKPEAEVQPLILTQWLGNQVSGLNPIHLSSSLSHMSAKWPGQVISCFWMSVFTFLRKMGRTKWHMCIHCTRQST